MPAFNQAGTLTPALGGIDDPQSLTLGKRKNRNINQKCGFSFHTLMSQCFLVLGMKLEDSFF